jgi:hypothetical protein
MKLRFPHLCIRSLLVLLAAAPVSAQSPARDPLSTVQRLFDAMRMQDTAAMRATLHDEARLLGTGTNQQGQPTARLIATAGWLRGIAGAPAKTDERIYEPEVRIYQDLATIWTRYDFFLGDNFSHCGYDSFQLISAGLSWKIVQVADTQRRSADLCGRGSARSVESKPSAADTTAITNALKQVFDALRAQDSLAVIAGFLPEARVVSMGDDGAAIRPVSEWAALVTLDRPSASLRERQPQELRISDNLATTWGYYDGGVPGAGAHCGSVAAQFARTSAGWKVAHLTQTIGPPPCQLRR